MKYGEYAVVVNFDDDAGFFHGDVSGIRDGISFQGNTAAELKEEFKNSMAEYLKFCAERGREPDQSFTGATLPEVTADVNQAIAAATNSEGEDINARPSETEAMRAEAQTA